jgi:hypothetical protein
MDSMVARVWWTVSAVVATSGVFLEKRRIFPVRVVSTVWGSVGNPFGAARPSECFDFKQFSSKLNILLTFRMYSKPTLEP